MSDSLQRLPAFGYSSERKRSRESSGLRLYCEKIPLEELAQRFGTPLYVYSSAGIRDRVGAFRKAFQDIEHSICYSVKANSNLSILRLLGKLNCGFDVVSGGELQRVLRANSRAAGKVVFSGVGKTADEINAALKAGILLFNLESSSELEALAACAHQLKRKAGIAFRVNPDVPANTHPYISTGLQRHKFGVPIRDARELYKHAARHHYLEVKGVSVHIGSQITEVSPFAAAMRRIAELVADLRADGHKIEYVDAGGGLGINYGAQEDFASVADYAKALIAPLRDLKVKLLLEPGRAIVGGAGVLLTRVLYRKTNGDKKFIVVDAAMNDLMRPSLYQAEHQIVPVRSSDQASETVDIVGPVCESGDFLARDRELPAVVEGDLLAVLDAGAYGMTLASNYNTRPRPAEILVDGKRARVIRKRETIQDLLRLEN